MTTKNTHGGSRPGAGRRANDRKCMVLVRISPEAHEMLKPVRNKSEYVDRLIKEDYEREQQEALGNVAPGIEGIEDWREAQGVTRIEEGRRNDVDGVTYGNARAMPFSVDDANRRILEDPTEAWHEGALD